MDITNSELNDFMAHFPPKISQEIVDFVRDVAFKSSRYIFTRREGRHQLGYCTHCHNDFKVETAPLKHNSYTHCPECGSDCIVKASGRGRKKMIDEVYFTWYEKSVLNPQIVVARGLYAVRDYRNDYFQVESQFKPIAMYIFEAGNPRMIKRWAYYSELENHCRVGAWEKCRSVFSLINHDHFAHIESYYSRENIEAAVSGTPFRYSTWEQYDIEDMTPFFSLSAKYPCIEYLTKLGMKNLVSAKLEGAKTYKTINWRGKNLFRVLKLSKKELNEIKTQTIPVTFEMLKVLQMGKKDGSNFSPEEAYSITRDYAYSFNYLEKLHHYGNLRKITTYLTKQREKNPRQFYNAHSVVITWRDYIADCVKLEMVPAQDYPILRCKRLECPFHGCMGDNTCQLPSVSQKAPGLILEWAPRIDYCNRPSVYCQVSNTLYPRNLYQAHQNLMKQIKLKADHELNQKILARVPELNKNYEFKFNGLIIRPAATVNELLGEGKALHHCVGTYGDRYANGVTDILLIRDIQKPNTPFFTAEVQRGKVIQVHGKNNCPPTKEIEAFMEAFKSQKLAKKSNGKVKVSVPA